MVSFILFLTACATPVSTPTGLDEALKGRHAVPLKMQTNPAGLIIIEDIKIGDKSYRFALDTGATHSAIFEESLQLSAAKFEEARNKLVYGMISSQTRRIAKIPKFELGSIQLLQKPLIILPDREFNFGANEPFDGLIGMDILADYQIYVSPKTSEFILIANEFPVIAPYHWDRIELTENPFRDDQRDLHFMEVRLAGENIAALIDTGAEFSVMNWNSAQYAELKSIKKRLRKEWELQGAIGTFEPSTKVTLERFRSGQKFWKFKEFVVMNFDSLNVLGLSDDPFAIVGMNLFKDESFFIDFDRNYMAVKSGENRRPSFYESIPVRLH